MASARYYDRCKALSEIAEGICARAYFFKCSGPLKRDCLVNAEFLKLRQKLDKSFPEFNDIVKTPGYESLRSSAGSVLAQLQPMYDVLVDAADLAAAAEELFRDVSIEWLEFSLSRNRGISLGLLDAVAWYMRTLLVIQAVDERRVVAALHSLAFTTINAAAEPNFPAVIQLIATTSNCQNHFIATFKQRDVVLGPLLLRLGPVLAARQDADALKNKNILSPLDDGELMGAPAYRPVMTATDELSMYAELALAQKYSDYVCFGALACPALLYTQPFLDLFRLAAGDRLVLTVYRDLVLNVHSELEAISLGTQLKKDITVERTYKLKPVLKELVKEATQKVGSLHRERRSLFRVELGTLNDLLAVCPGLLGPKFPLVVAAAALARAEILHYFNHQAADGGSGKKDSKRTYEDSAEVVPLLGELFRLLVFARDHESVVHNYYAQYMRECDAPAIADLVSALNEADPSGSAAIAPVLGAIQASTTNAGRHGGDEDAAMLALRLDWDRLAAMATCKQPACGALAKSLEFGTLLKRLNSVSEKSCFVGSLDGIYRDFFVPHNIWWYRGHMRELFAAEIANADANIRSSHAGLSVLYLAQCVVSMTAHEDCPEETASIGESATSFAETCLKELADYIETALRQLWEQYEALENQVLPVEAAGRLEKTGKDASSGAASSSKAGGGGGDGGKKRLNLERLPGYESESGQRAQAIGALVSIKRNIVAVFSSFQHFGRVAVFDKEFDMEATIMRQITVFLERAVRNAVMKSDTDIGRPSIALHRLIVCFQAVQDVCAIVGSDAAAVFRTVLFNNFVSTSLPPPTVPMRLTQLAAVDQGSADGALIWKVAAWFVKLAELASTPDSGAVWVPSQRSFARTRDSAFPADTFLGPRDLAALVAFIGTQGVRVINLELMRLIQSKVGKIKTFVTDNATPLSEFSASFFQSLAPLRGMRPAALDGLLRDAVTCGVALALRQALAECTNDHLRSAAPFLAETAEVVARAADPWDGGLSELAPVHTLAADCGLLGAPDLSLIAALDGLQDARIFDMLPATFAAMFAAPQWANASYVMSLEAFGGNEHCIMLALARLIEFFSTAVSTGGDVGETQIYARRAAIRFIEISSHVLTMQRIFEGEDPNRDKPLRPMSVLLEHFVAYSPLVTRGDLERAFPYALLHDSQVDIAMGKMRFQDSIVRGLDVFMKDN